jgi:hypothetical protein
MPFIQIEVRRDGHLLFESSIAPSDRTINEVLSFWDSYTYDKFDMQFVGHLHIDIVAHITSFPTYSITIINRG